MKSCIEFTWDLAKNESTLLQWVEKEPYLLVLDPQGKLLDSEAFSDCLFYHLEKGGSRVSLLIGGAEGIPSAIKKRAQEVISLSKMTFTHQVTRLILVEQIYRALQIKKGSPYHK